jgi:major membrane immunogen (membrane-anchored lipoprotein)
MAVLQIMPFDQQEWHDLMWFTVIDGKIAIAEFKGKEPDAFSTNSPN